jgi:hypothetical protein
VINLTGSLRPAVSPEPLGTKRKFIGFHMDYAEIRIKTLHRYKRHLLRDYTDADKILESETMNAEFVRKRVSGTTVKRKKPLHPSQPSICRYVGDLQCRKLRDHENSRQIRCLPCHPRKMALGILPVVVSKPELQTWQGGP